MGFWVRQALQQLLPLPISALLCSVSRPPRTTRLFHFLSRPNAPEALESSPFTFFAVCQTPTARKRKMLFRVLCRTRFLKGCGGKVKLTAQAANRKKKSPMLKANKSLEGLVAAVYSPFKPNGDLNLEMVQAQVSSKESPCMACSFYFSVSPSCLVLSRWLCTKLIFLNNSNILNVSYSSQLC